MTPEQEMMLDFAFRCGIYFELTCLAIILVFIAFLVSSLISWAKERRARRKREREMDIPRHIRRD